MITKMSIWAREIIIAIIISSVLQIMIPENKNKKYIKVVIGIYILLSIISPIASNSINLDEYNIEKYISINNTDEKNTETYNSNVKKLFKQKVEQSIKKELNNKGYDSNDIFIETDDNYNIKFVEISNLFELESDSLLVNKVEINTKEKQLKMIADNEKEELITIISKNYNVNRDSILFN